MERNADAGGIRGSRQAYAGGRAHADNAGDDAWSCDIRGNSLHALALPRAEAAAAAGSLRITHQESHRARDRAV